jgi:RNA polymerase sigma factor (sigma-70 family)
LFFTKAYLPKGRYAFSFVSVHRLPILVFAKKSGLEEKQLKYQPRKVFVLENGNYQEITYQEHCQNQQSDESYKNRFFIPLQGMLLEVSREVYAEFYREKERNRYLKKLDIENGLFSIDSFEKADGSGVDYIADTVADMAEDVMEQLLLDKLRECISLLSFEEQKLIHQHYYDEISEVELSREYGISQQAVSKRLKKVREKLKNLLEQ